MDSYPTSYLDLVRACDNFPIKTNTREQYYELYLPDDDSPHGYLTEDTVAKMPWTTDFHIKHDQPRAVFVLDISDGKDTANAVNAAFARLVNLCIDQDLFHVLDHKHSEPFAILGANTPVYVERFATSLFGVTSCGAHLVAYVRSASGLKLWIPRRASHLYSSPNMLDTTVGGGVKAGTSPLQTMIEEAAEEASLPEHLIRSSVRARGVITNIWVTGEEWPGEKGLVVPGIMYVYDIELPQDFTPRPHDDEVKEFHCMSIDAVQKAILASEFKPDAAVVLVDFMIRQGILTAENEKAYVKINMHLHRQLPFRIAPAVRR